MNENHVQQGKQPSGVAGNSDIHRIYFIPKYWVGNVFDMRLK